MLRVAILCSGRAPGLPHLLAEAARHAKDWRIACCLTSEDTFDGVRDVVTRGIPVVSHPVRHFYFDGEAPMGDMRLRADYDTATVHRLKGYSPDVVLLSGYLLKLTEPMLTAFPDRIINVHHADLTLRTPSGAPKYPGLRAVRAAILAGERETRSTAHIVTPRLDDGPMLARSEAYPVPEMARWALEAGEQDILRALIWSHQEWMLRTAFGPLFERALDAVCEEVAA